MDSYSLTCFGIGDGWPNADRSHSAFLYRIGGDAILIDAGEPISSTYKRSGLSYDLVDRIFLSHLHFDHVGGLFMLLQGFWLEGRTKELRIHLPAHGITAVRQLLEAGCIFEDLFRFRLIFEPLKPGEPISIGNVTLTPYPTTHLEGMRQSYEQKYPGVFEAFSFLIEAGAIRIGHSADMGAVKDLEPLLAQPLDLLVCELAHIRPEHLFRHIQHRKIKQAVFIHLARQHWAQLANLQQTATEMLRDFPFSFARDGEEIVPARAV